MRAEFVESYCFDYEINCLFDVLAARVAVVVSYGGRKHAALGLAKDSPRRPFFNPDNHQLLMFLK